MSRQQLKDTLSIVSAGRSTLYRQYYAKIEGLTEMVLLDMLCKSFRYIKELTLISAVWTAHQPPPDRPLA